MKKSQLHKDIQRRFDDETDKISEAPPEKRDRETFFRMLLSLTMASVILGSLIYTIVTSIK